MNKEDIYKQISNSKNYKDVCDETIKRIIDEEVPKYKREKEVVKEVKNKLHQIHGSFVNNNANKEVLKILNDNSDEKEICMKLLDLHTSTRERNSLYNDFYKEIFSVTGIPSAIMDIACGFNPFSIPFMNLDNRFKYYAYDINKETTKLINTYFKKYSYDGNAYDNDIICHIPNEVVDVVFIFKLLPVLEQQKAGYSLTLLNNLKAKYIVVTFPTMTLTGKKVGMLKNYALNFEEMIKGKYRILKNITLYNELVYIIEKE